MREKGIVERRLDNYFVARLLTKMSLKSVWTLSLSLSRNTNFSLSASARAVSRYDCEASIKKASLTIDIASKVYPLEQDTEITFAISTKLRKEGEDPEDFDQSGEKSHLDDYEYGMYGKVFEYKSKGGDDGDMVEIFASFGGLLMKLVAPKAELKSVSLDDYIYVLIKKNVGSYM